MSTNKVYGDAPNELPLKELETRWEYADKADFTGIREDMRIDRCKHSLFGASKVAADVMVQEYGRYFGMKTCCLRGGCLTGPNHSGVELHGFLSYLVKCNLEGRKYTVFGYKGKQVRDNIHSLDVARFIHAFIDNPRSGEVYNLGGGRNNSCSILEAFKLAEDVSGKKMQYDYVDKNREGDHICYISDLSKMKQHYPDVGYHQVAERHLQRDPPELDPANDAIQKRVIHRTNDLIGHGDFRVAVVFICAGDQFHTQRERTRRTVARWPRKTALKNKVSARAQRSAGFDYLLQGHARGRHGGCRQLQALLVDHHVDRLPRHRVPRRTAVRVVQGSRFERARSCRLFAISAIARPAAWASPGAKSITLSRSRNSASRFSPRVVTTGSP